MKQTFNFSRHDMWDGCILSELTVSIIDALNSDEKQLFGRIPNIRPVDSNYSAEFFYISVLCLKVLKRWILKQFHLILEG